MYITLHNYICVQIGKPHISLGKSRLLLFFKSRHCLKHNCPFRHLEGISLLQLLPFPLSAVGKTSLLMEPHGKKSGFVLESSPATHVLHKELIMHSNA